MIILPNACVFSGLHCQPFLYFRKVHVSAQSRGQNSNRIYACIHLNVDHCHTLLIFDTRNKSRQNLRGYLSCFLLVHKSNQIVKFYLYCENLLTDTFVNCSMLTIFTKVIISLYSKMHTYMFLNDSLQINLTATRLVICKLN